jgi:hypothetical protein
MTDEYEKGIMTAEARREYLGGLIRDVRTAADGLEEGELGYSYGYAQFTNYRFRPITDGSFGDLYQSTDMRRATC